MSTDGKVVLKQSRFGSVLNPQTKLREKVKKFTWKTVNRLEVSLITFGARLIEIKIPDRKGKAEDILMGCQELDDYLADNNFKLGAAIGPISGIIKNGEFCLKGKIHRVRKNFQNRHCKDGGEQSFSKVNWSSFVDGSDVILSHATDGTNGFPGIVLVQILFSVKSNNSIAIKTSARSNQVTPIDISHRLFFNLSSHGAGESELYKHLFTVASRKVQEQNDDGLFKKASSNDSKDVSLETLAAGESINKLYISEEKSSDNGKAFVLRAVHPTSGRVLEVYSNQPTLHFSTCSEFPVKEDEFSDGRSDGDSFKPFTLDYLRTKLTEKEIEYFKCRVDSDSMKMNSRRDVDEQLYNCKHMKSENDETINQIIKGKDGATYYKNSGFSISCQNFPNAVNHQRSHPDILLQPGQVYENVLELKFEIHVKEKPEGKYQEKDQAPHFPIKLPTCDKFPTLDAFQYLNKSC